MSEKTFASDFRQFFVRGLAILLPSVVTLWILWQAFGFVFKNVAEPINRGTRLAVIWVVPRVVDEGQLPEWFVVSDERIAEARAARTGRVRVADETIRREIQRANLRDYWEKHWYLNLTGLFIAILLIYLAGLLLGNFFGRRIYLRLEGLIAKVPGFKHVYPHVKQVVDLILGEQKMAFNKVVLVEYPHDGIWTVGLLTGNSIRAIDSHAGGEVVSIFIPTSPTPFTGFTINVPKERVFEMDMTVDQALRFIITAGVLTPDKDRELLAGGARDGAPATVLAPAGAAAMAEAARQRRESGGDAPGGPADPEGEKGGGGGT